MKAKSIKRVRRVAVTAISIMALATSLKVNTNEISAADTVKADQIEDVYAGAALDLDVDITPTEEEVLEIVESNAWKMPGAVVMSNVVNSVNVRAEADPDAEIIGKLYSDCGGYVVEYTDTWTKIQTGNCIGWVSNEYLFFGDEALKKADDVGCNHATIVAKTVRVRKGASTEEEILGLVAEGEVFDVVEEDGEWLVVDFEGDRGYINSEFAQVEFSIDTGETLEEISKREAAEKAVEKAVERETTRNQYYGQYAAEASDVELLAALIHCEAGNQPHEGKVAVGAVVMNRVRSGAYPNTIYSVIYASGQFTPAGSGAVDKRIANGVDADCIAAAQEALSGYSPVGDATHFRPTGKHDGIIIAGHVFW